MAVTAAADTAIDVARRSRDLGLLAVLDAFLRRFWVDDTSARGSLCDALRRGRRLRGIRQVARWLDFADPRSESPMQSRARFRLLDAGLPAPDLQIPVETSRGLRFLDVGWRRSRVGVDDEREGYHTGTGAMQRDRLRHNDLTGQTWTMLYPTASDVDTRHPIFVATVRRAIDRAPLDGAGGWPAPIPRPPRGWLPGRR